MVDNPLLFSDHQAHLSQMRQGRISGRAVICALAMLSVRIDLVRKMFIRESGAGGAYTLRLSKNGIPTDVKIDDRLPCDGTGKPLFSHFKSSNLFWIALVEKAYAKLNDGSYDNIVSGAVRDVLADFIGGVSFRHSIENETSAHDTDPIRVDNSGMLQQTWDFIQRSGRDGSVLSGLISLSSKKRTGVQCIEGTCMLKDHTYPVIGFYENQGKRFVELYNPWKEFDPEHRWTQALEEYRQIVSSWGPFADDRSTTSTFLLAIEDVYSTFDVLEGSFLVRGWETEICEGRWSKDDSTPFSRQTGRAITCPQYAIRVHYESNVIISLLRTGAGTHQIKSYESAIGFNVIRLDAKRFNPRKPHRMDRISLFNPRNEFARTQLWQHRREAVLELKSCPPGLYLIIPSQNIPDDESFTLRAFAQSSKIQLLVLRSADEMYSSCSINGKWLKGSTAGGCINTFHWIRNQQFSFEISAPENTSTIGIRVTLVREDIEGDLAPNSAGFYFIEPRSSNPDAPQFAPKSIIGKSPFRNSRVVQLIANVQCNKRYIIVPCTFERDVEGEFSIHISHRKDLSPDAVLKLSPHGDQFNRQTIRSQWSNQNNTTGGCSKHVDTFMNNPKFCLTLGSDADIDMLLCQAHRPFSGIGFHLFDLNMTRVLAKTRSWIKAGVVQYIFSLKKGRFIIMPSTFNRHDEREFEICIISNADDITLEPHV